MAGDGGFWSKVTGEVRTVSERARGATRRTVAAGVLRVDLMTLRRDRSRALADLGERTLLHWNAGAPEAVASDPEAARIRERIASLNRDIEVKRAAIDRLREEGRAGSAARKSPPPAMTASNAP